MDNKEEDRIQTGRLWRTQPGDWSELKGEPGPEMLSMLEGMTEGTTEGMVRLVELVGLVRIG